MEKSREFDAFLRRVSAVLHLRRVQKAPAGLADRIMSRVAAERQGSYEDFLRFLRPVVHTHRAGHVPESLTERIMGRVAAERPPVYGWGLRPAFAAAAVMVTLFAFSLRHEGPRQAPLEDPQILSFTLDRVEVGVSQPITLRWKVRNAQNIEIRHPQAAVVQSQGPDSLTVSIQKPGAYKFILIATSNTGRTSTALTP